MPPIRVAIAGVGNCASALVQGLVHYLPVADGAGCGGGAGLGLGPGARAGGAGSGGGRGAGAVEDDQLEALGLEQAIAAANRLFRGADPRLNPNMVATADPSGSGSVSGTSTA